MRARKAKRAQSASTRLQTVQSDECSSVPLTPELPTVQLDALARQMPPADPEVTLLSFPGFEESKWVCLDNYHLPQLVWQDYPSSSPTCQIRA